MAAINAGSMPKLTFSAGNPPLAILAAAKLAGAALDISADAKLPRDVQPVLAFPTGDELTGTANVVRFLARACPDSRLYPADPLAACQVDAFIDFSIAQLVSGVGLESTCASLDSYLSMRTFLVGHSATLADAVAWGALQQASMWMKLRKQFPHLLRWHEFFGGLPAVAEVLGAWSGKKGGGKAPAAATSSAAGGDGKRKVIVGSFDVDLKGAEMGKVVTRFPPEPSGYLHIGHAKAAILNQEIANLYNGKVLVRFDDTNPSKEKDEYVENIIDDIKRLGLKFESITYTSDYFPQLADCVEKLIQSGHVYADDTPVEEMRDQRMHGVESARRGRSVEETLRVWGEMGEGSEEGRKNCLRVKMDMTAANKALRDPVVYRCNATHHWRTGHTYKCYPTYDFACPFVDAIEGVTHALRTSEYKDREPQYYWMLKLQQGVWPSLPQVHIWDYSRLSFIFTVLSKRKLTWFVEKGMVDGWADPRMPTVQGMLRRGLTVEALREFILFQGASKNVTYQEWDKIWAFNKKIIDPVCPRHTAVETQGRVPVALTGAPNPPQEAEIPRHVKNPAVGTKKQLRSNSLWLDQVDAAVLTEGDEFTLMGWGNAIVEKVHRASPEGPVTKIEARLHLEGDFKKTKLKLTWLADSPELPAVEMNHFGYLITKRKLEEADTFEEFVNHDSRTVTMAVGDANLRSLPKGEILQLERKGYFIIDVPFDPSQPGKPIVMFNIPDGRTKTMMGGDSGVA